MNWNKVANSNNPVCFEMLKTTRVYQEGYSAESAEHDKPSHTWSLILVCALGWRFIIYFWPQKSIPMAFLPVEISLCNCQQFTRKFTRIRVLVNPLVSAILSKVPILCISECNTIQSAYTLYRHLGQFCTQPSKYGCHLWDCFADSVDTDQGSYSPTILQNVLSLVLQIFFLYLAAFSCNKTSDWLNHTI